MAFSFADFGFWRFAVVSMILELAHALLMSHWPGIETNRRLGPRPLGAVLFMSAETFALFFAVAAGIGTIEKMLKLPERPIRQLSAVFLMTLLLLGVFCLVWKS